MLMVVVFFVEMSRAESNEPVFFPVRPFPVSEPDLPEKELERLYRDYISRDFTDVIPLIARQFKPEPLGLPSYGVMPA